MLFVALLVLPVLFFLGRLYIGQCDLIIRRCTVYARRVRFAREQTLRRTK